MGLGIMAVGVVGGVGVGGGVRVGVTGGVGDVGEVGMGVVGVGVAGGVNGCKGAFRGEGVESMEAGISSNEPPHAPPVI